MLAPQQADKKKLQPVSRGGASGGRTVPLRNISPPKLQVVSDRRRPPSEL